MGERKRRLPPFLEGKVPEGAYLRWLSRKAAAHVRRDRKREMGDAMGALYCDAIHDAVLASEGRDAYTGEALDWSLISQYDNDLSKEGRHHYKAGFALLPTVDHLSSSASSASFRICAWRTNDAKNDMSVEAFVLLCAKVLIQAGYRVENPQAMAVATPDSANMAARLV